ncbi:hypothetical protein BDW74DRAFT_171010 [Aspergillus multicolor]|uniref:uncharacterized protein n=1 Tax=Aspergillus multicolor TaxID=41759 RepID=UPI003CCDE4EC
MISGIICLCLIASISTWSNYVIGRFKLKHPEIYAIDDAGDLMFGRAGCEFLGIGVCLCEICTAVFVAVAAVAAMVSFALASIRTFGIIKWPAWAGLGCIVAAVFMVTIAVGIQDRPPSAPQDDNWTPDYNLPGSPSSTKAISAVSAIVYSHAGTPGFFPIAANMRDLLLYTRCLLICQSSVTAIHITIGIIIYYYCGSYVGSPALGSAGTRIETVSYVPGLVASTIVVLHFPSKYIFVSTLRGLKHLTANKLIHWVTWFGCTQRGIRIFNDLVSLIGALLVTLMIGRQQPSLKWALQEPSSVLVVCLGTFLMVAGTYGSIVSIIDSSKAASGHLNVIYPQTFNHQLGILSAGMHWSDSGYVDGLPTQRT